MVGGKGLLKIIAAGAVSADGPQAMGKGMQALVLFSCRLGFFNIPLLFVMNRLIGMYGMVWVQLMAETLVIPVSFLLYFLELRKLGREEKAARA